MTTIISLDQSLSKCFYTVTIDGVVCDKGAIKTGSSSSKKHLKSAFYFDTVAEQCHFICDVISDLHDSYKPCLWVLEALSFGSGGNAEKSLASLFGAIVERLFVIGVTPDQIKTFSPQTVKSYARKLLPEDEQTVVNAKGKDTKVKMEKNLMIKAVKCAMPEEYFENYKCSGENAGLDDLCDSWVLSKLGEEYFESLK